MKAADIFNVRGRRAFVTGAASGLGLAMATALAENGARVVMTDIDADRLEDARRSLARAGGSVETARLDITDTDAIGQAIDAAASAMGGLDIVLANAGISGGPGPLTASGCLAGLSMEHWNAILHANVTSVFATIRAAAPHLAASGRGRIVVTASTAGIRAEPQVGYVYTAGKAAVANLVRQAAMELGRQGTVINAIAPGPFRTNIGGGRMHDPAFTEPFVARTMLGRLAEPHELAGLTLLLTSDAASYITGTVIPIDGGTTAW